MKLKTSYKRAVVDSGAGVGARNQGTRVFCPQGSGDEHMVKLNMREKRLQQKRKEASPSCHDELEDLSLHKHGCGRRPGEHSISTTTFT